LNITNKRNWSTFDNNALMMNNYQGTRADYFEKPSLLSSATPMDDKDADLDQNPKEDDQDERYIFLYELAQRTTVRKSFATKSSTPS